MPELESDKMSQLQRIVFTRFVNQKLEVGKRPKINDIVMDLGDGTALVNLLEVLSDTQFTGKPLKAVKAKIQMVDQANRALQFAKDVGVTSKVWASAENLIDNEELPIMGLVWAIMQKFLKFGDDEDGEIKLSAEDSLLMWVKNQLHGYDVEVKGFAKSFQDGKVFAALIHKFRPQLIDPTSAGMEKVFEAAEIYFDLERFIQPSDVPLLDPKSTFIFVSEFYYGIARQRKVDLACRRVTKLVKYTITNDEMRASYQAKATELVERLDKVTAVLNDRTIDNTMAGAQSKIASFQQYKADDKPVIVSAFLTLEGLYNHLAMRLAEHSRPKYEPGERKSVPELREALKQLEVTEKERQVALVAELNRQIRLQQLNEQHEAKHTKLTEWQSKNESLLSKKEDIQSSGEAEYQINKVLNFNDESKIVAETTVVDLKAVGAELKQEKFEHSDLVESREAAIDAGFAKLGDLSANKKTVLDDDLARMKVKEATHLVNLKHTAKFDQISSWTAEKQAYLSKEEDINSIADAKLQISVLDMYISDLQDVKDGSIASLKAVGKEVLDAKYESNLSSWSFENPDEVTGREAQVDTKLEELKVLEDAKSQTLDAALKKEIEKERLRLLFATQSKEFSRYVESQIELLTSAHFGFNLQEVEAYQAIIETNFAEVASTVSTKQSHYKQTFSEAQSLGVAENRYTTRTLDSLAENATSLEAAQAECKTRYEAELARQRHNDALCRAFAEIAEPFVASFETNKEIVTSSSSTLEEQLAYIESKIAEDTQLRETLSKIEAAQAAVDEVGVKNNPHSHYTFKDASVQLEQYLMFLDSKSKQLKEEIQHRALKGLTEEQNAEIEAQFKQFDKDSSGSLMKNEFKSCLYSLGEDKTSKQVAEIMNTYGSETEGISHEGFKAFMVEQLGDTDTSEEIVAGFELINKGEDVARVVYMQRTNLRQEDIKYIEDTAPAKGEGYDYQAWTTDVFSR